MRPLIPLACLAAAVATTLSAGAALANPPRYSIVGAGCVPTDDTTSSGKAETGSFGVKVRGLGVASYICPIPITGEVGDLVIYYGGTNATNNVEVFLRHAEKGSNFAENRLACASTTGGTKSTCHLGDQLFWNDFWWLEVTITRTSSARNPEFQGAVLTAVD
jgi:hypothetical protein